MLKTNWLFGLALVAVITPACTTNTSLGREGTDAGRQEGGAQPAPRCTIEPTQVDVSCNEDRNLDLPAGTCGADGTCTCRSGFVLNPTSNRCRLAVDAEVAMCIVGDDQTCDDSKSSKGGGICLGKGCACNAGFLINPATGRCRKIDPGTTPDASVNDDDPTGQTCYWQDLGALYGLKRFRYLLTTPDGQAQSPPKLVDAGPSWPINDFEGRIVEKAGNQLSIDSCLTPATCQPSLYHFVLCDRSPCSLQSAPGTIDVPIPVGRRVRVVWHLDTGHPVFCPGLFWLAIYDAEPGAGQGNLLFLGSGGREPGAAGSVRDYMGDLPFSVAIEALECGPRPDSGFQGGDYRFVFSPKGGAGTTLKLATGESGSFEFAEGAGSKQRMQVHSLVAVQPAVSDNYWNWDFWMAGESTSTPVDAGSNDAPGVCTFGKNQTCNDESWASWVAGTCQSNGTCVCASGYVMNPSSGRCAYVPKDAGPDLADAKTVCTPGMNQTCNDDPVSAAVMGVCQANGTCSCNSGYVLNTTTGKCMRPATNTCTGSYTACGCGCCGGTTPQALCYYPSAGDSLSTIKSADEAIKNDKAKCEMAGCSMGQRYLCCTEAAAEPAGSAQYSASYIAGGYDRISIKKTGNDGNCMQLTLVSPVPTGTSSNPLRVSTPARWAIEAPIFKSTCGSSGTSEQAVGAQGTVTYVPNGTSCALGAHLTVFFYSTASGNISTARFDAEDIPVSGGVSSGYCR